MPLPDGGPWPPKEFANAYERLATWSAWYSGDPDELSAIYQRLGQRMANRPNTRPSQMRGGLVGTLARWFWGQPIPLGEKRSKLHVPIAGDIAATSADLLFSEPITVTVPADTTDTTTQDQLDALLDDSMHAQLLESAEVGASLGGVYLRAVWDKDVNPDGPWLAAVHADAAIPEWQYGRLKAVTIFRVLSEDSSKIVRHLERHEPGAILHGVYEGSATELGRPVPLTDYADTAGLADSITTAGNIIETGVDTLTCGYVPNMRPNRLWRNEPAAAHLGRSDYAGVESLMDGLDEVFTSWMRDVRLAKARLIVPDTYLQDRGPGRGALFDPDREVYEALNMLPGQGMEISAQQFAIRVDEHSRTALDLVTRIVSGAGYSGQTFGLTGDVAVTATEIAARERRSLITREKKIRYWRPELACMFEVLLQLGVVHFGWKVTPIKPDVEFPDAVQQDPTSLAQTLALLEQARAVSTETKVEMLHPDWDEDKVSEEVGKINGEAGITVTNPDTFTGTTPPPLDVPVEPAIAPEPPAVAPGTYVGA